VALWSVPLQIQTSIPLDSFIICTEESRSDSLQRGNFLFFKTFRPWLWSSLQSSGQWKTGALSPGAKRPERDGDRSPPCSADGKNEESSTSTPLGWFRLEIWKLWGLWGGVERGTCPLCRREESATHILLNCQKTKRWREKYLGKKWPQRNDAAAIKKLVKVLQNYRSKTVWHISVQSQM
jgi:hypothetical protein